ncbi:hypothetical protein WJ438_15445 [Streptomyces sp. GD-15H]|uniref:hypothetical protein n=1 Tax=Streptomyces sp. GD-15H TaxID=3129112 RepID=UPI00325224BF
MSASRRPFAPALSACPTAPVPDTLAYGFTPPAQLTSPASARAASRELLRAHGQAGLVDPVLQGMSEPGGETGMRAALPGAGARSYGSPPAPVPLPSG